MTVASDNPLGEFGKMFQAVTGVSVREAVEAHLDGPEAEQQLLEKVSDNARRPVDTFEAAVHEVLADDLLKTLKP